MGGELRAARVGGGGEVVILGRMHIDGNPVPKNRARTVALSGDRVRTYTPKETVAYERLIGLSWRGPRGFADPVKVTVAVVEGRTGHPADLDNYGKSVLDGLNGIAFLDDKQVVGLAASIIRNDTRPGIDVIVEGWPVH